MLLYLSTRPDLAHAVHVLSRYLHNPAQIHFEYAKHTLRYLRGTSKYGLLYTNNNDDTTDTISSSGIAHATFVNPPPKIIKPGTVKFSDTVNVATLTTTVTVMVLLHLLFILMIQVNYLIYLRPQD